MTTWTYNYIHALKKTKEWEIKKAHRDNFFGEGDSVSKTEENDFLMFLTKENHVCEHS